MPNQLGHLTRDLPPPDTAGIVAAGVGLDGGKPGIMEGLNVPEGSSVVQAYLYWVGYADSQDPNDF